MADVNIDMLLSDSTRSIGRRRREVQGLNQELERTRGLMASQSSGGGGGEREGYDRARGSIGTGAAGRDFANQSRGLGGVVALYATFAANIFAVSAAFQNLQQAANFERLIKASEMMSERTGINLKGLGKNLQEATGYAISFEEAMQFANLGTSAGIAAKQMESLVAIAKGAAAGLGRDVNDAVRRIIQGTAKQEQEILDELGIFIKAKKAYDDYAKKFQITGGADALSAQQRVSAYADAVEQAGNKWKDFAKIDDPFSRFVATGREAINTILNFINIAIKPLIGFLAESKDAIIALATVISLSLARRALPQLKDLFVDLFTYNKARAKALAQQQRMDIAKEMALTSNLIATEQAKLAALAASTQALTMQTLAGTFAPGMLARTGAKGQAIGPGIAPKKLEQAVFGTAAKPVDLASYTKIADLEKQYKKAIDETIGKNQVKLDQMKQLGVLQNASIIGETKLTAATKASAAAMFASIQQYNAGLITRLELERQIGAMQDKNAARALQLAASTPGAFVPLDRYKRPEVAPTPGSPPPPPRPPSTLSLMGSAIAGPIGAGWSAGKSVYAPATAAFTKALAEIGENNKQMANAMGAGLTANLKQAAVVMKNHAQTIGGFVMDTVTGFKNLGNSAAGISKGTALASVGLASLSVVVATTAAVVSTLGLALKALMAALGPLMLLWAAWDLLIKDMVISEKGKEVIKLNEQFKELTTVSNQVTSSLGRINEVLYDGIKNQNEYSKVVEVVKNNIISQIDGIQALGKKIQALKDVDVRKKAKEEFKERNEFYSEEILAIDQIIVANNKLQLSSAETTAEIIKQRNKLSWALYNKQKADEQAGSLLGIPIIGASALKNLIGFETKEQAAAKKQLEEAYKGLEAPLTDVRGATERREALLAELTTAGKNIDTAIDDMQKKIKKIPKLGELATNETSKAVADEFAKFGKMFVNGEAQIKDTKGLETAYQGLYDKIERLAPISLQAAIALDILKLAQTDGISVTDRFKIALGEIGGIIVDLNTKFAKYSATNQKAFTSAENVINSLTLAITRQDMVLASSTSFADRIQDIRGFALAEEIEERSTQERLKANLEYSKQIKQAELEYQKVKKQGEGVSSAGATDEELEAADQKLQYAKAEAKLTLEQKYQTIGITEENNRLENTLKQIEQRYETINRKLELQYARAEGTLRIEEERLRVLREAGAYSEPKLVELETQGQQRQIESTFGKEKTAAVNAAQKEIDLINDKADALLKTLKTQEQIDTATAGRGIALENIADKERDAIKSAEIRRDIDLEVLRISSQAKKIYAELAETEKTLAQAETLRKTGVETQSQLLDLQKQELQYKLDIGLITQDIYDRETSGLDKVIRLQEFKNKQLEIEAKYQETLRKIETDRQVAYATKPVVNELGEIETDPAILAALKARGDVATAQRNAELGGLAAIFSKNEQLKGMYASMSTEQKGLAGIYKDTFASMGDAIVEFVKTGKLSFKSLITDMLAQIAKLYLNKMFMSLFSSLLPGLPGLGTASNLVSVQGVPNARGNIYSDTGLMKFAKGGTFTNSIVDSPTLFKFAKGTGIMGEAGPEAIMPLKRDGQGNLGVRGGGSNVEVVVNNYSTAKAETRESTDSRGNRRVEVVIGDMTAGEITRNGSTTQRALGGTFGLQPQLIRR